MNEFNCVQSDVRNVASSDIRTHCGANVVGIRPIEENDAVVLPPHFMSASSYHQGLASYVI